MTTFDMIWQKQDKWIIGIDEAGRGPLAGPVAVGLVAMSSEQYRNYDFLKLGLRDSKKLTEKTREKWHAWLQVQVKAKQLRFVVSLVSARSIDEHGIVPSIRAGIVNCLTKFESYLSNGAPSEAVPDLEIKRLRCQVLLDGGLRAPKHYVDQKTIIRGDESEPIISLASIVAKVTRDRHMLELAKRYPNYGFEKHKGYGTAVHYEKIKLHGRCAEHRASFLRNYGV